MSWADGKVAIAAWHQELHGIRNCKAAGAATPAVKIFTAGVLRRHEPGRPENCPDDISPDIWYNVDMKGYHAVNMEQYT